MMKKIEITVRTDKPKESGNYLTFRVSKLLGKATSLGDVYYNADTGRWNDNGGDGEHAFDVDMWAEIPHGELADIREE